MRHYLKLSGLFFGFTIAVTLWMSFELGLLSFGSLEAAEEKKPILEKAVEVKSPNPNGSDVSPVSLSDEALGVRAKELSEKEEFLKKQSEYYERVIVELKEKLTVLVKENKQKLSKTEEGFEGKLKEKENEWKNQLAKKDSELSNLKKELETWKDARAELFRGLYEKMESKKAAKILESMDVDLSNKILASMKQDKAADIMSKMVPEKARLITERTFPNRELSSQNKVNQPQSTENSK